MIERLDRLARRIEALFEALPEWSQFCLVLAALWALMIYAPVGSFLMQPLTFNGG